MEFFVKESEDGFNVLRAMLDIQRSYGYVTVADLKQLIDDTDELTYLDSTIGWPEEDKLFKSTDLLPDNTVRMEINDPVSLTNMHSTLTLRKELRETMKVLDEMIDEIKKSAEKLGVPYTTVTDKRGKLMAKDLIVAKAMILSSMAEMTVRNV